MYKRLVYVLFSVLALLLLTAGISTAAQQQQQRALAATDPDNCTLFCEGYCNDVGPVEGPGVRAECHETVVHDGAGPNTGGYVTAGATAEVCVVGSCTPATVPTTRSGGQVNDSTWVQRDGDPTQTTLAEVGEFFCVGQGSDQICNPEVKVDHEQQEYDFFAGSDSSVEVAGNSVSPNVPAFCVDTGLRNCTVESDPGSEEVNVLFVGAELPKANTP